MKILCIVSCGYKKIWDIYPCAGSVEAKSLYIGPFAKKCMEYAEKFYPDTWYILSAKYGFLLPCDPVEGPYNVTFNKRNPEPITIKDLSTQALEKRLNDYEQIVVVGGRRYVEIIKDVFLPKEVHAPLSGLKGIGFMMGKMKDSISRNTQL